MPAIKFDITSQQHTDLLNKDIRLKDFLTEVLHSDANKHEDINSSLLEFHKADGGAPETPGFWIVDCWYDNAAQVGRVRLEYEVSFTFGCADIHRTDRFTETCKFEINSENTKLILLITDHITRDTIDEF